MSASGSVTLSTSARSRTEFRGQIFAVVGGSMVNATSPLTDPLTSQRPLE
jgi:hypothetical protein